MVNCKRVLVTGCGGLIGRSLVKRLLDHGHFVVGLDAKQSSDQSGLSSFVEADLREIHSIYATLDQFNITHVVHCGAISGPMIARDLPHRICDINVTGTLNVLEAARVMNIQRLVYCSSASIYGRTPPSPVTEFAPYSPPTSIVRLRRLAICWCRPMVNKTTLIPLRYEFHGSLAPIDKQIV